MSAASSSPFSARVVLGLLLFGAIAFLATLYFIGSGQTGGSDNNGGGHAAGKGLNGYAALAGLLETRGYEVGYVRNPARFDDETLLILTPPRFMEAEDLNTIIDERRYVGPTIVILPKWSALPVPANAKAETKQGWVVLMTPGSPEWAGGLGHEGMIDVAVSSDVRDGANGWHGLGLVGGFPDSKTVQTMTSGALVPLVWDDNGQDLVSYTDDGYFPMLAERANVAPPEEGDGVDEEAWPVVIVAEPDLMNNYGLADRTRAMLALSIVDATLEDYDMPIAFDLTLNGLGRSQNLLTLAFSPPFLAATICLLIAAIIVGWRGFGRFGPPIANAPVFAFGKRQLATNGAALIQRSKRLHLLGAPYAAILRARIAALLGIRATGDAAQIEAEIDRLLALRGIENTSFAIQADALRAARGGHELLRRAHALKQIERMLSR